MIGRTHSNPKNFARALIRCIVRGKSGRTYFVGGGRTESSTRLPAGCDRGHPVRLNGQTLTKDVLSNPTLSKTIPRPGGGSRTLPNSICTLCTDIRLPYNRQYSFGVVETKLPKIDNHGTSLCQRDQFVAVARPPMLRFLHSTSRPQ